MKDQSALLTSIKQDLRARLRARLRGIPAPRRDQDSARAGALLARQRVWREAKAVLFYWPRPDELDLLPLLEQALAEGRTAALPRFFPETGRYAACQIDNLSRDCAPGKFGLREPAARRPIFPLNRLDLALVPGVGFDAAGHRLGRGQGHYDRLLAGAAGTRCGVAFDEQMVEQIPAGPHDITLNCIITPTRWVEIPGQRPILP
ncbi:MAG: 5-formyltetrahydrofolate cyclo-ligase [Verrucomicrobiota bacterium]|jgi:5-formyltetrahydrofolate cyclo-ligase